jgi:hypothetical protein
MALPAPHSTLDYLSYRSELLMNTQTMPAIEEAWEELGLRYDTGLKTVVIKPEVHAMTLRSHRLTRGLKRAMNKHLPLCDVCELMTTLRDKVTVICFIKKNGSLRRMRCSLKDQVGNQDIGIRKTEPNKFTAVCDSGILMKNNLLRVWDLEKHAWRSLYIDSIISVDGCFFIA